MKISIGMKLQSGPFGGGNQFGHSLVNYLTSRQIQVEYDLKSPDLDLILLTDPRLHLSSCQYNHANILRYLLNVNPMAIVVHRINECDERKNTTGVNSLLREATRVADHTVFVSSYLKNLHLSQGMAVNGCRVIHNGADRTIFNSDGHLKWDGKSKLRIVTHHWSNHWLKGFDIYKRMDELLSQPAFADQFEFTYIGRIPDNFSLTNSTQKEPLFGKALANELKRHHVYLTASRNEPGSNHNIEGAGCGLPILFLDSGSMTETSDEWGWKFIEEDFEKKLLEVKNSYSTLAAKMADYPFTSDRTCQEYLTLFESLLKEPERLVARRNFSGKPLWLLKHWWQGRISK